MKPLSVLRFLFLGLVLSTISLQAHESWATDRSPSSSADPVLTPRFSTQFGSGVNIITQGAATTNRTNLFNMLLGANGTAATWPAYPRLWYEEYDSKTLASNTYWHPSIKALNGGVEIEYKYGRKTTLVLMTSAQATTPPGAEGKVQEAEDFEVVHSDPKTHRNYPTIRKGVPMVGFCSFEMSLVITKGISGGLELLGAGSKITGNHAHGVTFTVYSKFFEVPKDTSTADIFNGYCISEFERKIRAQAEKNFIPVIIEQTLYNNPNSRCQPTPQDGPSGDVQCMQWFSQVDYLRRAVSVPRCVTQRSGISMCMLKAKENMRCPMYRGQQKLTRETLAFDCDAGYSCTMTKAPIEKWGFVAMLGDSFCKKR